MSIHAPQKWRYGAKVGKTEFVCSFIPLEMQYPGPGAIRSKQRKNRLCDFGSRRKQSFGSQKNEKPRESDISPICSDAPIGAIIFRYV